MTETPGIAHKIINLMATRKPQALELARYLSIAARVEPALLRKVRLTFLPKSEPGLEADLWFSSLVQSRGPNAIIFRPDIVALLREDLVEQDKQDHRLVQIWELLRVVHRTSPAALRLEEEITYLALSGQSDASSEIEARLQKVAATMVQTTRASDLTRWAARALPQLPQQVRQTDIVAVLALAASARLGNYRILDVPFFPNENVRGWLPDLLPKNLARVQVGVRLFDQVLEFGDPDLEESHTLDVPKTNPVLLEVSWNDSLSPTYVRWTPKQNQFIRVGSGPIIIRTVLGETYRLQMIQSSINQFNSAQETIDSIDNNTTTTIKLSSKTFEKLVYALLNLSLDKNQYKEVLLQGMPDRLINSISDWNAPLQYVQSIVQKVAEWGLMEDGTLPILKLIDNASAIVAKDDEDRKTLEALRAELNADMSHGISGTNASLFVQRMRPVALIQSPDGARGTGFLIAPDLLLTANYVLPDPAKAEECDVLFGYTANTSERPSSVGIYTCSVTEPEGFFYSSSRLPFTIVRVNKPTTPGKEFGFLPIIHAESTLDISTPITILQYIKNEHIQASFGEIAVLNTDRYNIHYIANTGPGSSGAPVLNDSGQVIAMHYASSVPENQGIGLTIKSIIDELEINAPQVISVLEEASNPSLDDILDKNRTNIQDQELRFIIEQKWLNRNFDVFLCYNAADKDMINGLAISLLKNGILPFFDDWIGKTKKSFLRHLEEQLSTVKSAAVFIGKAGIGLWQQQELDAFLRESVERGISVIPVLLPDAPNDLQLPTFIQNRTWVDFRTQDLNPIEQLLWGITGQHSRIDATSQLQSKRETGDFDVFLCYNGVDKPIIRKVAQQLLEQGVLPWLDDWELRPGLPWDRVMERQIQMNKSAAVFIGRSGIGPWQQEIISAFVREFVSRGAPVIPVLLPDASNDPQLPTFIQYHTWVDFRKQDPDPMEQLLWGIRGQNNLTDPASLIQRKRERGDFDVFLCYNRVSSPTIKRIAKQLLEQGIVPWLDEWELPPGLPWQQVLAKQIQRIRSAAIFIDGSGIGRWQQEIIDAFLSESVKRGASVIPVFLPDAPKDPYIPSLLKNRISVDFRRQDPDPIEHLIQIIMNT